MGNGGAVQFKVFGRVEALRGEDSCVVGRSKVGQMVSLLLARNNEIVSVDTLIAELWGERVPRSALTTLQTYVYHARKLFETHLSVASPEKLLVTHSSGYLIAVADGALDAARFERLVKEGVGRFNAGDVESASVQISEALHISRGSAFSGVPLGRVLEAHVTYLQELRFSAIGVRIEANRRLGRHRELIPELRALVSEYPLNESFHAELIGALHHCGRRAEALQAYRKLWNLLDDELGVQPSAQLQDVYQKILV
ncbi:AfsR/SARP family transcriptional regulator [Streptomyces sp. BH097]|uniref:AfsR/SARP family transcriptional regulator n=1 Tax=unclassified Streptomyces TaxID=2593676 RepID=UPI003BB48DF2